MASSNPKADRTAAPVQTRSDDAWPPFDGSKVNVQRLRYFCTVADELHFGRAAQRLHMAQPPLSQQIRLLETELGFDLFRRTTRKVELTTRGHQLLPHAIELCREADQFLRRSRELRTGEGGLLRLGFVDSASYDIMPRFLHRYRQQYPAVDYELRSLSSDQQVEALNDGTIDIGLCRTTAANSPVDASVIATEPLLIAVPTDHQLCGKKQISIADLAEENFIGFDRSVSPTMHRDFVGLFEQRGIVYDPIIEATEYTTILGIVASGQGLAVVPAGVRTFNPPTLRYLDLADDDATANLLLVTRKGEQAPVVERAVDLARSMF